MSQNEIAWAAGIFEGEGTISHHQENAHGKSGSYTRRRLQLTMCDQDVVHRFCEAVGCGKVYFYEHADKSKGWTPYSRWTCSHWPDVEATLRLFLPYFGERRLKKALEVLADPPRPYVKSDVA